MSIDSIKFGLQGLQPINKPVAPTEIKKEEVAGDAKGFGELFSNAISEVDQLQQTADKKIEGLILNKGVTPHDAMIALEKADIAFQLMNQIRSKIVRAYEEVMRTQI